MRNLVVVLLAAALLSGCVRASTAMLDDRTAIISGRGTAWDSQSAVVQRTLVEAATTTINGGYRYFAVVTAANTSVHGTAYIPGDSHTTGSIAGYGNTATYTETTTTDPGALVPYVKPGASITIKMYREGEVDPTKAAGLWDAQKVLAAQK